MQENEELKKENASDDLEYGLDSNVRAKIIEYLEQNRPARAREIFSDLHPAEQADFITSISSELREELITAIADDTDPQFLVHLENDIKNEVIELLGTKASAKAIGKLDIDDAVYVIEDLEDKVNVDEILSHVSEEKRSEIEEALAYPESSVGRLMRQDFVAVKKDWTVAEATKYVQEKQDLPEDFRYIIVVDEKNNPISEVLVSKILISKKNVLISEIMSDIAELKKLNPNTDQEDAARLFSKYSLTYAPVVDHENGELLGVIYSDDIIDILEEEAEEDILLLGGVNDTNLYSSSYITAKSRAPWLITSLFTGIFTVLIINFFSAEIQKIVVLAALMPVVASLAGNAGTQALTVLVRTIATNEINNVGLVKTLFKEIFVASINGLVLALLAGAALLIWQKDLYLGVVLAASIFGAITIGGLFGAAIPIILERLKFDPAISSGVFLIAITDSCSFLIFLGLASIFML